MTVYVITAGEYSDYHIVGVTLDKETAEQFAKNHTESYSYDDYEIEEYDTDFIKEVSDKNVYEVCYVTAFKKFKVIEIEPMFFDNTNVTKESWFYPPHYTTKVIATSEEDALKIGKDRIIPVLVRDGIMDA